MRLTIASQITNQSHWPSYMQSGVLLQFISIAGELGYLVGKSAGLVVERLRVRIPAGAAGEFPSSEFGTTKTPVILPKVQVAGYT